MWTHLGMAEVTLKVGHYHLWSCPLTSIHKQDFLQHTITQAHQYSENSFVDHDRVQCFSKQTYVKNVAKMMKFSHFYEKCIQKCSH